MAGDPPPDVFETVLAAEGGFRGGLHFIPAVGAENAVIVYFHGGGFLAGSPSTHRCMAAWLARLSGMRVLSAAYRLVPEHPFPAQREDAVAACAKALALSDRASKDTGLILAGDSAGACVALWGLRALDPQTRARIKGVMLFYGGYGLSESDSIARYGTPENGLDSETLSIMYRRLSGRIGFRTTAWLGRWTLPARSPNRPMFSPPSGMRCSMIRPGCFKLSGRRLRPIEFVVAEGQEHGFFKRTGKDPIAMRELENAARWAAERARPS